QSQRAARKAEAGGQPAPERRSEVGQLCTNFALRDPGLWPPGAPQLHAAPAPKGRGSEMQRSSQHLRSETERLAGAAPRQPLADGLDRQAFEETNPLNAEMGMRLIHPRHPNWWLPWQTKAVPWHCRH
uniref:Uncharacterized protein n=1 Tax=Phasianus colchicus TaxID=9054 RepID=A0A669QZA2_PHACC